MATKVKKSPRKGRDSGGTKNIREKRRFWLMYPPKMITTPVIWDLARRFPIVTNVRQASVTDEIGIVCLELEGDRADIKAGVRWLEKVGIKVEPVEISVIAG